MSDYTVRAWNTIIENLPLEALIILSTGLYFILKDRRRYSRILRQMNAKSMSQELVTAEQVVIAKTPKGPALLIRETSFCSKLADILAPEALSLLAEYANHSCLKDPRIWGHYACPNESKSGAMKTIYDILFRYFKADMSKLSNGKKSWFYCIPSNFRDTKQLQVLRFLIVPKALMEAFAADNYWWATLLVEKQEHYEHLLTLRQLALKLKENDWMIPGVQLLQYSIDSHYSNNPRRPPKPINWFTPNKMRALESLDLNPGSFPPNKNMNA